MKNNKGFAPIAIVLIIVAVLAVGGIAYYAGKSSTPAPQNVPENNVTNNPVVNSNTPPPTTVTGETAIWKTYKNDKYGIEFKIPQNWIVFETFRKCPSGGCDGDSPITHIYAGENKTSNTPTTVNEYDAEKFIKRGLDISVWSSKRKLFENMKEGSDMAMPYTKTMEENKLMSENYASRNCPDGRIINTTIGGLPAIEVYEKENYCYSNIYEFVVKGGEFAYEISPLPLNYDYNFKSAEIMSKLDIKSETEKSVPEFNKILVSLRFY